MHRISLLLRTLIPESYFNQSSERLIFQRLSKEIIPLWEPFFDDERATGFVGMNAGIYKEKSANERATLWIERAIQRYDEGIFGQLGVWTKDHKTFLGLISLISRQEPGFEGEIEVAYSLLPEARVKGYASEAAVHFKNWAFQTLEVESLLSIIHIKNEASQKVALKNGMTPGLETIFFRNARLRLPSF